MENAIIFGVGSFAEVAHFYLTHDSDYKVVAFTVHKDKIVNETFLNLPVIPFETVETIFHPSNYMMFIAVGYSQFNQVRKNVYYAAKQKGYKLLTYVSSRCSHWEKSLGDNCFIFEDNTIQPFVEIGSNVILWSGNHIGHHSNIGDHCFIASHVVVSGHVNIGEFTFIGVNATLRDNITIGKSCVIGAGALITRSTKDGEVYPGVASKPK